MYSYLTSTKLKSAIQDHYDLASFRVGTAGGHRIIVEDWHQSLMKEGIVNSNPFLFDEPISLIRENKQRSGNLRRLIRASSWLVEGAPIVAEESRKLIKLIDEELGK